MTGYTLNRAELARLQRRIHTNPETDCWEWTGQLNSNGYGWAQRGPGHKPRVVHRIIWEHTHNKPVPSGLQLDHTCRNRRCCNPDHLEPVTGSENTRRQEHFNRSKTTCPKGHEYTDENTRITKEGRRQCRACDRARKASVIAVASADAAAPQSGGNRGAAAVGDTHMEDSGAGTPRQIGMPSWESLPSEF